MDPLLPLLPAASLLSGPGGLWWGAHRPRAECESAHLDWTASMIFHPLHCSARKVNTCYKTRGEAGPAPSCPLGGRGGEGPPCHAITEHWLIHILQTGTPGSKRLSHQPKVTQLGRIQTEVGLKLQPVGSSPAGVDQACPCAASLCSQLCLSRHPRDPQALASWGWGERGWGMCLLICRFWGSSQTHQLQSQRAGPGISISECPPGGGEAVPLENGCLSTGGPGLFPGRRGSVVRNRPPVLHTPLSAGMLPFLFQTGSPKHLSQPGSERGPLQLLGKQ